jgi:hypothetical protein
MIACLKQRGQALVEFALAATLIFFLLAAAVDLGFMFFALQGLHNAAQEGGTFGSRWLQSDTVTGQRKLRVNDIRDRIRMESGTRGGIGFVNLLDLNNNGVPDVPAGQSVAICTSNPAACDKTTTGATVATDYIQVAMINDSNGNGDPLDDGAAPTYTACTKANSPTCFIYVQVTFDYRLFFPLSPTFGRERQLKSSFVMKMRDDVAREGVPESTPPVFVPAPTPTPSVMKVQINNVYYKTTGGTSTISVKALVTLNGLPFTGPVTGSVGKGSTSFPITLSSIGGGFYTACYAGSFSGPLGSASATVSASNGAASDSDAMNASPSSFPECP